MTVNGRRQPLVANPIDVRLGREAVIPDCIPERRLVAEKRLDTFHIPQDLMGSGSNLIRHQLLIFCWHAKATASSDV